MAIAELPEDGELELGEVLLPPGRRIVTGGNEPPRAPQKPPNW